MLEEVQVPPGALRGVMDGAFLAALSTREAAAPLEVKKQVQTLVGYVELYLLDLPRLHQA